MSDITTKPKNQFSDFIRKFTESRKLEAKEDYKLFKEKVEIEDFQYIFSSLANSIAKKAPEEIYMAARRGLNRAIVYRYGDNARYKDKPLAYLLNGPQKYGLKYFEDRDIKHTLQYLHELLPGFTIRHEKFTNEYRDTYNQIVFEW